MTRPNKLLIVLVAVPFFLSGFTSLVYQAVLNKFFGYIFGVGSYATATVLATFMLGLAVGGALFGRIASRRLERHLLWYGVLEFLIGLYGLALIRIGTALEAWYAPLAHSLGFLTLLRFLLALVLVGVPTVLMGGSLPLLMEGIKRRGLRQRINLLYGVNVAGAALGTLLGAYAVLPHAHLDGALRAIFAVNALVLLIAAALDFSFAAERQAAPAPAMISFTRLPFFLGAVAFFSGYITFSNEVYWTHLLSLVIGTSTYAYAIMLFTTLAGMAAAGLLVQRTFRGRDHRKLLAAAQAVLGLSLLASIPLWDRVPRLFLDAGVFVQSFAGMEALRFVGCCSLIALPALCAGLTFPIALAVVEDEARELGASLGRLYAINTLGSVLGSLLGGFVLLDLLGGRNALFLSALLSLAAAVFMLRPSVLRRTALGVAGAGAWALAVLLFPRWDAKALLSGANIYFSQAHDDFDELVWQREDYVGGVTSIIRSGKTLTMLTNGKFQGNNGSEVVDQRRFALIPNLFVRDAGRALNIGLGTGTTLGTIARFPYREVDVVELSKDVVAAADRYFADVNEGSLHKPNVRVHVEDGRNFLALNHERPYDLISIELTSIWFAGAGNLYNDEFYALAKKNLTPGGVLQQWIQLHHIDPPQIAAILKTLRQHFRYVQLWLPSHQGIVVASDQPLQLWPARLSDLQRSFGNEEFLFDDRWTLLGELFLTESQVDAFLAAQERAAPVPVSTDLNLFLEYATPRGNALGWNFSENLEAMLPFSSPDFERLLPLPLRRDRRILAMATLGRAHFFPKFLPSWHRQVAQALALLVDGERQELKRRLRAGSAQTARQLQIAAP